MFISLKLLHRVKQEAKELAIKVYEVTAKGELSRDYGWMSIGLFSDSSLSNNSRGDHEKGQE